MSNFTPGPWWIAPPMFDGDVIYAPAQHEGRRNEVVATCITNPADAKLISAAPVMYELLRLWTTLQAEPSLKIARAKASKLLAAIDEQEDVE